MTKIAFVGAGNMAGSLIQGLLAAGWPPGDMRAADPDAGQRARLSTAAGIHVDEDNRDAVAGADVIVLAVKPQVMGSVCRTLAAGAPLRAPLGAPLRAPLFVSIAAGIRLQSLESWLGALPIVRCMPNTPALLRAGITALTANAHAGADHVALADRVLSAAGATVWLDQEPLLDAVTAVSGSGPAYFFYLMEAMIDAGVQAGLTPEIARQLTVETAAGAARMAQQSSGTLQALRQSVTSAGGTTEAALAILGTANFAALVQRAVFAARDRSVVLADELGRG